MCVCVFDVVTGINLGDMRNYFYNIKITRVDKAVRSRSQLCSVLRPVKWKLQYQSGKINKIIPQVL